MTAVPALRLRPAAPAAWALAVLAALLPAPSCAAAEISVHLDSAIHHGGQGRFLVVTLANPTTADISLPTLAGAYYGSLLLGDGSSLSRYELERVARMKVDTSYELTTVVLKPGGTLSYALDERELVEVRSFARDDHPTRAALASGARAVAIYPVFPGRTSEVCSALVTLHE